MHSVTTGTAIPPPTLSKPLLGLLGASQQGKCKIASPTKGAGPLKSRKEQASNWIFLEILDMVAVKKQEFLEDIEVELARELMFP